MGKTLARIYVANFEYNIQQIKEIAPNKKICLALKANAYGHGSVQIAKIAIKLGIEYLSVATVDEAIELRNAGIKAPILLLSLCHKDEIALLVKHSITPLVADTDFIDLLSESLLQKKISNFPVHIKVDTGMARHGVEEKQSLKLALHILEKKSLSIEGLCTHFAVSDSLLQDDIDFTKQQIQIFNRVVTTLKENSINPSILHCAASGGILLHPDSHFDMVRPGILAYGYYPSKDLDEHLRPRFKPVMELVSYVTAIKSIQKGTSVSYGRKWTAKKTTRIATISTGYGDGLRRSLSGQMSVTIQNKRYKVVGRICMDQCVIEVNEKVQRWDEVILFGPKAECNTAMSLANSIDTIPYEIVCLICPRVKRVYV